MRSNILIFILCAFPFIAVAQTSTYVSSVDADLTIQRWTTYPLIDNLGGIYANPLQTQLKTLMEETPQFRWVDPARDLKIAPEEFEDHAGLAVDFQKKSKVDGFIAGRISKGPQGLSIRLGLFSGENGLPVGFETKSEIKSFHIEDLKKDLTQTYFRLISKIPYRGKLLSRRDSGVTINAGQNSHLREGQEVFAVQITHVQRHPKFGFLINVEKEIMGKIRITKVEDALSFGTIVSERSEGLLKPGFKVMFEDFVDYGEPGRLKDGHFITGVGQNPNSDLAFGKDPKEWQPLSPPSFGKLALLLGVGSYTLSNNLVTSGSVDAKNSMLLSPHIEGEMWLSAHWFMQLELHHYSAQMNNGLAGSAPSSLSMQTLETELLGGYNVLVGEEFWGPKLQLLFGMNQMDSKIGDSTPKAYTSMQYGGLAIGVGGSIPMSQETELPLTIGGKFIYDFMPTLSEAPASSGSSSTTSISKFSLFGEYQTKPRMALKAELSFHQYNTNFSGKGSRSEAATSAAHSITTIAGGVVFLF